MASIRIRNKNWQARVSRAGYPPEVRTFGSRQDAERWARSIESDIDKGLHVSPAKAESTTLKQVIERYITEVCPTKRSGFTEAIRLRATSRTALARLTMVALNPQVIAAYRDERLKQVSPGTVIRDLSYLSSIINHARREWGINIPNPVPLIRKPATPQGRERILSADEQTRLLAQLTPIGRRNPWLKAATMLSLETALRQGELLRLRWGDIDLENQTAFLPITKNGIARTVPLSKKAVSILSALPRDAEGNVFPIKSANLHAAFRRACSRADIVNFRWHDLRHTAITKLANKLPNVIELAAVSGHRSLAMLKRYYHPSAIDLAKKLD